MSDAAPALAPTTVRMSFRDYLEKVQRYEVVKQFPDGRWLVLWKLMFHYAMLTIRDGDALEYADRWCYRDRALALVAALAWDGTGEPEGWHRHPPTDRRLVRGVIRTVKEQQELARQGIFPDNP